jgi:hypothetical protein
MSSKISSAWIVPFSDGRAKCAGIRLCDGAPVQGALSYSRQTHHTLEQRIDFIHSQRIITYMFNAQ